MNENEVETAQTPTGQTVEIVPGSESPVQKVNPITIIAGSHVANPVTNPQTEADRQKKRNGGFGSRY